MYNRQNFIKALFKIARAVCHVRYTEFEFNLSNINVSAPIYAKTSYSQNI